MTKFKNNIFDVIVIGGGHAGVEAALASARMQVNTLLLTDKIATLGQMSCNPAIGGIGKGHLVKEIDALDGAMAKAIDVAGIHFRILNASKGPAVRATRAQADRLLYKQAIKKILDEQANLTIIEQTVEDLIIENNQAVGVITNLGEEFRSQTIILAVGTFLNGKLHFGLENKPGGRIGDAPANILAQNLRKLPHKIARLKTGTPPRIAHASVDFTKMQIQNVDLPLPFFSFLGSALEHPIQVPCFITRTNEKTHAIISANLNRSPLYTGIIEGIGPRYCPSIEDKVVRFADKKSHQIFIEPESLERKEVYPNGISTSLPLDVQIELVRSIEGLENAEITQPGYAIEYDFFDPRDLAFSLESKLVGSLFFAGQINGTTGYEEAAAQGLLAGINAALKVKKQKPWFPLRHEAYMGVMLDDLLLCGVDEPYRMFTSRAEYRLILREDNADLRLTDIGFKIGVVSERRFQKFCKKRDTIASEKERLQKIWCRPKDIAAKKLTEIVHTPFEREYSVLDLLRRPEIKYMHFVDAGYIEENGLNADVIEQIEFQMKYEGYILRQQTEIKRQLSHENKVLPDNIDYLKVPSLSNEVRQKLIKIRPKTIGAASRIPGVTPASISLLLVYLKKYAFTTRAS